MDREPSNDPSGRHPQPVNTAERRRQPAVTGERLPERPAYDVLVADDWNVILGRRLMTDDTIRAGRR